MVSTAAFHARVRGSVPGLGGFKETKMFLPHPCVKVSIVGSQFSLYVHKGGLKPDSFHFIIRNIPEQKYFADIKPVTADSPDLSDSVTELAYSMLTSFTPQMGITIEEENILVYITGYICYKVT